MTFLGIAIGVIVVLFLGIALLQIIGRLTDNLLSNLDRESIVVGIAVVAVVSIISAVIIKNDKAFLNL